MPFYVLVLAAIWLAGENPIVYSWYFFQLIALRAITDIFAEGFKMHALAHGDISLVSSFMSLSPMFLLLLEPFVTDDKLSLQRMVGVVLVVCGSLVLLYKPPATGWARQRSGILLGIAASVFFTLNTLLDTLASRTGAKTTSDFSAAVFSAFAVTLLSALLIFPIVLRRTHWQSMTAHQNALWPRGFLEMVFMVSKLYALQHMAPSDVSSIMRLALILSIVGGRVYFREGDFRRRMAAGILIVVGVVIVIWFHEPVLIPNVNPT